MITFLNKLSERIISPNYFNTDMSKNTRKKQTLIFNRTTHLDSIKITDVQNRYMYELKYRYVL